MQVAVPERCMRGLRNEVVRVSAGRGVLVVGMHRSGTSAATAALARLGLRTCREEDLFETREGNARGYWESEPLVRFNDALLGRLGGTWRLPPAAESLEAAPDREPDLRDARRAFERGHPEAPWVWKDPRNCLLLPFWRAAIGRPVATVLMLRDPLEIAASLHSRDGMEESWTLALWERYLRSALANLAGEPVYVSDYRGLVDDPIGWARQVGAFLAQRGLPATAIDEAAATVDIDLRHHTNGSAASDARLSAEQRRLWERALELRGPHDALPTSDLPAETARTAERLSRPAPARGAELGPEWARWLAKNRLLGLPDAQLVALMVEKGVDEVAARAEAARLDREPAFQAGRSIAGRLRKLESLLAIQASLSELVPEARAVERHASLEPEEFLRRFYAANRPVILEGYAADWAARLWTPESLADVLGDEQVEVMAGRENDSRYEVNSEQHRLTLPFRDFVRQVREGGHSNDVYLVANNHLLERPAAAPLLEDFEALPPLDPSAGRNAFLWFGPGGTVTPLHHDVMNVLFVQLHGRKRFTLIAPSYTPRLYNELGVFSEVDPREPDLAAHPAFEGVPTIAVDLAPGETLFLPVGWWHHVEALDVSISLSFTGFAQPNSFRWQHPG